MATKKIARTEAGKRALKQARSGQPGIGPGGRSSIKTATFDIPGPGGRTDVAIVPTIRKVGGKLVELTPARAYRTAIATGDFARVKGGHTKAEIEAARERADKRSQRFSRRLGRVTARTSRQRKITATEKRLKGG